MILQASFRLRKKESVRIHSCTHAFLTTTSTSTTTNTTITLLQDSNQHDNGLALCLRVILDSEAHPWVQAGHPRYTGARKGRPWVAHTRRPPTDDQTTQTGVKTNVLSTRQVLMVLDRC